MKTSLQSLHGRALSRVLTLALTLLATVASSVAHAAPSTLDTSFGGGTGKVFSDLSGGSNRLYNVLPQPGGKLLALGTCAPFSNSFICLTRYLSNGTLDPTLTVFLNGSSAPGVQNNESAGMALQIDGKIVVAGSCSLGAAPKQFCVFRLSADGVLDTSFGGAGRVLIDIANGDDTASGVAIQADGKIVVAGTCTSVVGVVTNNNFCVARLTTSGAVDTTFAGGSVITSVGLLNDTASGIVIQPDGNIVVGGHCSASGSGRFCMVRYQPNGSLDPNFGVSGTVIANISGSQFVRSVLLQPDGKLLLAGECPTSNYVCFARFLPNGAVDFSFGQLGGKVLGNYFSLKAATLQPDGKILAVGSGCNGNDRFCAVRLHSSGETDTSLNGVSNFGLLFTPMQSASDTATVQTAMVQPDGKIVLAGFCKLLTASFPNFCIARHEGGPNAYRACSLDIDGDGQVLATTDLLIASRVALGMSGAAVLNGINLVGKPRSTWPDIRDHLVRQCGMAIAP
jgi:uncharacterized delta-60 repeat protein